MTGLLGDLQAKSALLQIQTSRIGQNRFGNVVGGARDAGAPAPRGDVFFSVSSGVKTETSIFSTLNESLGKARGSVALARVGTQGINKVLDGAEKIIGAVEAGAPGSAFKGALERLETGAAQAVNLAGRLGTNLLVEGETLNVTLGVQAGSNGFDFRQQSITALGLQATDGARGAATTVTETVTETVEVNVTRADRINERIDNLNTRVTRLDERVVRIEGRIDQISERQVSLGERITRLEGVEDRLNTRLEDVGARPTDATSQRFLDIATRIDDFADVLRDRGSTGLADFVDAVADRYAERAGLTISLDKLDRLESRLERVGDRIESTGERITQLETRKEQLGERITQVTERREQTVERIERFEERLTTLSEDRLNQVVGTRTETVEREVTRTIESPLAGSFGDVLQDLSDKIRSGDTDGARAIVAELRERTANVNTQLDQISGALDRRSGFFSALTDRLESSIKSKIEPLSEEDAARAAADAVSKSERTQRLFSSEGVRPGILELFQGTQPQEPAEVTPEETDTSVAETEAA
ncbi:MAG: hypothetical protein AAF830_17100 [Pseudomonadota bacterium]